jgi:magnesium-transporting ATPase (P-type)
MSELPQAAIKGPNDQASGEIWHAVDADRVLALLLTERGGLSSAEAKVRLATFGPNALPEPPRRPAWRRLLAQFDNMLIYFLLAAALAAAVLGHAIDAAVIVAVVTINAIAGFIQEDKAERALSAIRKMISPRAHVWRDGHRVSIPAADLVPGDVVMIEAGDRVPADLRLTRARGLLIDEAMLTGESVAADKQD